jgi:signal transduction histidine kinase
LEPAVITGLFLVDWALVSISLFNALLMMWLGLTVVLNAERRDWGVGLVTAGFMSGALFFVCHTVILGHELTVYGSADLEGWWRVGWYPVVLAPLAWYLVILWYVGFWEGASPRLRRLHRPMLWLLGGYTVLLVVLLTFVHPLPSYVDLTLLDFSGAATIAGIPVLLLLYPPFGCLCIMLSLDALRHPVPSQRIMGDLARRRARPWLLSATAALLLVVALVAGFIVWFSLYAHAYARTSLEPNRDAVRTVAYFDLLLETLIGLAIVLLGQAIVSYEIFTGQTLPRRGFFRQWRGAGLFAWGTAWIVGFALNWQVLPIFSFMLATAVMMVLYAFFGWRMFKHREELIARLRPFAISQGTEGLPGFAGLDQQALTLFTAICNDVLDTTRAYLIPLGTRVPLAGPPLTYPVSLAPPALRIAASLFPTPDTIIVALDAASYAGAVWGIPLWAGRGLLGALLLGPKRNNAVYTREEIEIARASAERILDTLTGEQIAHRLVQIQRRRFAETRVLDLRTRRSLHDNILPELHMIALQLSASAHRDPVVNDALQALTRVHHQVSDLIHTSGGTFVSNDRNGQLVQALQDMIEEEFAEVFDSITWHTTGAAFELDPLLHEVVYNAVREAVRNAALHGRGDQPERALNLIVDVRHDAAELCVEVRDDGVGMGLGPHADSAHDGESSAGSGGGLMLHSTMLAISGGELSVDSPAEGGTHVVISVPA